MFLLSSDSAKTTPAAGSESLPSPSFFSMANAYDMTGPVEILQLRHSPDKENNFSHFLKIISPVSIMPLFLLWKKSAI